MSKTVWVINQYASTPEYGYAGRHYYLGRELAKLGYKVYLISSARHHLLRKQPEIFSSFKLEQVSDGFSMVWCNMPNYRESHSRKRVLGWFLFPWRIRRLANLIPDAPDVVLCSSPSLLSFMGARYLAKRFKTKLVFEVRDIWPLTLMDIGGYSKYHPFIRLLQWVEDKAYSESDKVVSNLKNAVEHMVCRGLKREKFTWVPNGFSLEEVNRNTPLNKEALSQIPQGKFIVGYTGTLGVANALDTLIDAAEKLRYYSDVVFLLVGDGKEKETLQASAESKKLTNVVFVEAIPKIEIQAMLSKFDVCYVGLTKDPLFRFGVSPNKLFDYLYAGKPIVYGIESGEYKPVDENKAGLQVPAEDAQKLAEAVLELYQMPAAEREAMGANGRKAALEQYEYGQLAEKLARVLFDN
jgi:glycosyltransferase involved in cell wall biosynthesis